MGFFLCTVLCLTQLNAELVGKWTFNEGSGTIAHDSSGKGNDGTLVGGATWVTAPGSSGIQFNGSTGYINFGHAASLNLGNAFTIEAWVKIEGVSGEAMILGKDTTLYGLSYYTNGYTYLYGGGSGSNSIGYASPKSQYIHLVGTVNYGVPGNNMFLYVNGVQRVERISQYPMPGNAGNDLLAGTNLSHNGWFNGTIDELRLYSHALTQAEVAANYAAGPTIGLGFTNCREMWDNGHGLVGDLNRDCYVNFEDVADMVGSWLVCNDPCVAGCISYAPYMAVTTVQVNPGDDLKSVIESAWDNTTLLLSPGTYNVSQSIYIDQRLITITGSGSDTIVKLASDVYIGFQVCDGAEDLTIQNMSIQGTLPLQIATEAVACTGASYSVHRVAFRNLDIENVGVGIAIGIGPEGDYDGAIIENNTLKNILGISSGSGYGINNDSAKNVIIRNNYIENSQRHAIYQAYTTPDSNVTVQNNFIINQDYNNAQPNKYAAALVVARSPGVHCANNYVVNSRTLSMSVEYDEQYHSPVTNVNLVNNRIIGSRYIGLWCNTGTTITDLVTQVIKRTTNSYASFSLVNNYDVNDPLYGQPTTLAVPNVRWQTPDFITDLGDKIYVMKNNTLDEVVPYTWTYRTSPTNWLSTMGLGAMNGKLYIVQNGVLHEVDPTTWAYRYDNPLPQWGGTQFVTATTGYVFIIKNNIMYKVNPIDWSNSQYSFDCTGAQALYDWNGNVYLMQNNQQYRIDSTTGSKSLIGG
jgi:hypothetical protein